MFFNFAISQPHVLIKIVLIRKKNEVVPVFYFIATNLNFRDLICRSERIVIDTIFYISESVSTKNKT